MVRGVKERFAKIAALWVNVLGPLISRPPRIRKVCFG